MTLRKKTGTISFRPRARLLKLIGEELISDDVVAVSELVKNAHDADAATVTVAMRGVAGQHGEIEVRDDGCGMDLETLLSKWMEPAASTKVGDDHRLTAKGRRMLGEKGVGRFAADKLARKLELISRAQSSREEIRAEIDWDLFDDGERMLDEIKNRWEVRPASVIKPHGTVLRLSGLRAPWCERMFRRLSIRLGRLLSPFRQRDQFSIRIESDEFPQYSGELRSDILEKAPYRVEARFDGSQAISIRTEKMRTVQRRWNGHGELTCGPVRIRIFAFDLDGEAVARIGPRMEVRAWLKEWSGVSIYRDGFRIWPYGEPHDDWLRLDQRRVNNPVEHLSNNQVIGFIDITRDGNPELLDQTNREGLMNNRSLEDLRRLVYFVLQVLEAERQSVRHPLRRVNVLSPAPNGNGSFSLELEELATRATPELARDLRQLGRKITDEKSREQASQLRLLDGYADLAAIGQMVAGLLPVLPKDIEGMQSELRAIRHSLPQTNGHGDVIGRLAGSLADLTERLQLLSHASGGNDRRRAIDLVAEVETFRNSIVPLLESRGVWLEVDYPESQVLRTEMRPEHFHCLLHILTLNSLDWIGKSSSSKIRVVITANDQECDLVFSDTGPGIPSHLCIRVFEPRFSLKEAGRGMGLTVAKHLMETHGGYIHVITDGRRRGANIRLTFPRKRSRATFHGE